MTTAWVFPGQGSQAIGMGADLFASDAAQAKLAEAEAILGWSVPEICQNPDDQVSQTLYTQPCLYTVSALLTDALKAAGAQPDYVAGHSLGEYAALYAADVFEFGTGLALVKQRAELMSQATAGAMAAIMGCDREELEAAIAATEGVVLANDNNPGQVVISGIPAAVDTVMEKVKSKRALKLNVSGAFHSPLMAEASGRFAVVLDQARFQDASCPVLANIDPTPATDAQTIKVRLIQQMTGPVRWREISLALADLGVTQVVEVGAGKVLTGLIKRTCKDLSLANVGAIADVAAIAA